MGGQNHQPCSNYLPESTRFSRAISTSHAECQLANVALEDILLAELSGGRGTVEQFMDRLKASELSLDGALKCIDELEAKMDRNNFIDLPTLRTINLVAIGSNFIGRGMVDRDAWATAVTVIRDGGFYSMLPHFRSGIDGLKRLTSQLRQEAENLSKAVNAGEMNRVLEENCAGNIKTTFARLYSGWNSFNALFLASSLLSTEVWYAFRKHGSLADTSAQIRVA